MLCNFKKAAYPVTISNTAASIQNSLYKVRLHVASTELSKDPVNGGTAKSVNHEFETWLDETFTFTLNAQYDPVFTNTLADKLGLAGGIAKRAFGNFFQNKYTSMPIWNGTSPITVNLPFYFRAKSNAYDDVTQKVIDLMSIFSPGESVAGFLIPPSPSPIVEAAKAMEKFWGSSAAGAAASKAAGGALEGLAKMGVTGNVNQVISLDIGRFITLSPVYIEDMGFAFDSRFDAGGNPMSATVTLTIKTLYIPTKDSIKEMFKVANIVSNVTRSSPMQTSDEDNDLKSSENAQQVLAKQREAKSLKDTSTTATTRQTELVNLTVTLNLADASPYSPGSVTGGTDLQSFSLIGPREAILISGTKGSTANASVSAKGGYLFVGWTGDLNGLNPSGQVFLDGDKEITAHFVNLFMGG